jgi:hypothetical protein
MLPLVEPAQRRAFPPAEAGGLLIAVTALAIGLCTLLGWLAGAAKVGLIVGVVLGVPAGIGGVYIRYRGAFS